MSAWKSRWALGVLVVALRLPSLFEPQWYSDDGFFSVVAWSTSRGTALYSGIFDNQPPVIYWIYRLLFLLGGRTNHAVVQTAALVAVLAATLLLHEIGRRLLPAWPALLGALLAALTLSLPTLDGDLLNVEVAALPIYLAALLAASSERAWGALAAGALLGLAMATRPSYGLDGLALLVPLAAQPRPLVRLALAAVGGATVASLVVAALAAGGSLEAYRTLVLPADHAYLVWANGGSLLPVLSRLGLLGAVAGAALLRARSPATRLLAVWIPASLAGASLTPREFNHYAHEAVPPLALAISVLSARIGPRILAVPVSALALVAALELLLVIPAQQTALLTGDARPGPLLHNFGYGELPRYYANWALRVTGVESRERYQDFFPGFARDSAEVAFVNSRMRPGGRLLVLGDQPWIYIRSGRLPAGRFLATNSAFWRVPSAPAELRATIESGCAELIVYESGPGEWHPALAAGGYRELPGAPLPTYGRIEGANVAGGC